MRLLKKWTLVQNHVHRSHRRFKARPENIGRPVVPTKDGDVFLAIFAGYFGEILLWSYVVYRHCWTAQPKGITTVCSVQSQSSDCRPAQFLRNASILFGLPGGLVDFQVHIPHQTRGFISVHFPRMCLHWSSNFNEIAHHKFWLGQFMGGSTKDSTWMISLLDSWPCCGFQH